MGHYIEAGTAATVVAFRYSTRCPPGEILRYLPLH